MTDASLPKLTKAPLPVQTHTLKVEERLAKGKALREVTPRKTQKEWTSPPNRADPIDLLIESSKGRIEELLPIRYGRLMVSPFTFYRGAAAIMAYDLSHTPSTGQTLIADGDCHLLNFGGFATAERNLIFDINDFDEVSFAPWEWDRKRLAASFVVAGRSNGFSPDACKEAAWLAVQAYRQRMAEYTEMSTLDVWNDTFELETILENIIDKDLRRFYTKKIASATEQSAHEKEFALLTLFIMLFAPLGAVHAQDLPDVQELYSLLTSGQVDVLLIEGLRKGQDLFDFMENTSGNLDPVIFILSADGDLSATLQSYKDAVADLALNSANPLLDLPALRDQYALAWDDDSGPGYTSALPFTPTSSGDYYLVAGSSLSAAGRDTSGDYRLLIGLDAPQVLSGIAEPNGASNAVQDQSALATQLIQEFSGNLNTDKPSIIIKLRDFNPADILYVSLQAISGDLKPILALRDYGNKPIRVANMDGKASQASFEQSFPVGGANYALEVIAAAPDGVLTKGDFSLQVELNAPEVLQGQTQPNSESLLKLAIPVNVGLKLQQIINIDQPNEIMNDVGTLQLE